MKKLLEKNNQDWNRFQKSLREYRNTPRFDGLSPAQWLFGHRQRTDAVAAPNAYARVTDKQFQTHLDQRGKECDRIIERGPKRVGKKFKLGDKVKVQNPKTMRWSEDAVIIGVVSRRSFRLSNGSREFTWNRQFLRSTPPKPHSHQTTTQVDHINAPGNQHSHLSNARSQHGPTTRSRRSRRSDN